MISDWRLFRFQVSNLEQAIEAARAAGGTLEGQPYVYKHLTFAILRAPDGSTIEIVQDDSGTLKDEG